jgi:hypothetical protein
MALRAQETVCCTSLVNPVTSQYVCDCVGQASTYEGYFVSPQCDKVDIDECVTNNGGCMPDATCENLNGVFELGTRNCRCPVGMNGDGISRCDLFIYTTRFSLSVLGVTPDAMTTQQIVDALYSSSVVPSSVVPSNLNVVLSSLDLSNVDSTLLTITIISDSQTEMEDLTNTGISLLNISYVYPGQTVSVVQAPISIINTMDSALGGLKTILPGLTVDSVVYDATKLQWIVSAYYEPNMKNTISLLYVSKTGAPPYPTFVQVNLSHE